MFWFYFPQPQVHSSIKLSYGFSDPALPIPQPFLCLSLYSHKGFNYTVLPQQGEKAKWCFICAVHYHTNAHAHTHILTVICLYLCVKSLQSDRLHLTCHVSCVKKNKMKYLHLKEEKNILSFHYLTAHIISRQL